MHILKNIQFACSRINILYLSFGWGGGGGGSEPLQGQTGNHKFLGPAKKCLHSHDCFFSNLSVLCGLLWQDFCVVIFCLKACD